MALVVQKFGGTSVADPQKILAAAQKAVARHRAGDQVVVVVSAMGHQTDVLVDLARQISDRPSAREMDMLLSTGEQVSVALFAMAIQSLDVKAVSLTGAQVGIRTDSTHTKARIKSISTDHVQKLLDDGAIVIAAGFQGIDQNGNITTLGRGGSDTTAVALAAVLRADLCEIYTDVDGIFTTDPRLLPEAQRLESISYDEMLELASLGAGIMHPRSIEFAKKFGVRVLVRSSFNDVPGTLILPPVDQTTGQRRGAFQGRGQDHAGKRSRSAGLESRYFFTTGFLWYRRRHDHSECWPERSGRYLVHCAQRRSCSSVASFNRCSHATGRCRRLARQRTGESFCCGCWHGPQ